MAYFGPSIGEKLAEKRIARVSTAQPDHLRRRPVSLEQIEEVAVLGDDHGTRTPALSFGKDGVVLGIAEAEIANGDRLNLKRVREPVGKRWCYLRIDEKEHQSAAKRASERYAARIG